MILFAVLTMAVIPTEADAAIYEDTVRLHILAPSDSAEDQALKIAVRDLLLEKYSEELSVNSDAKGALLAIDSLLPDIERDIRVFLLEGGYNYTVRAELCEEWYDTREYGDLTLPMGNYYSLRITLGEGEGQNWWCVMYPPLCLDVATGTGGYTDTEQSLVTKGGYRIKFKLLEIISSLSGGR